MDKLHNQQGLILPLTLVFNLLLMGLILASLQISLIMQQDNQQSIKHLQKKLNNESLLNAVLNNANSGAELYTTALNTELELTVCLNNASFLIYPCTQSSSILSKGVFFAVRNGGVATEIKFSDNSSGHIYRLQLATQNIEIIAKPSLAIIHQRSR